MLSIKRREKKKYIRVLRKRKKKNIKVFVGCTQHCVEELHD